MRSGVRGTKRSCLSFSEMEGFLEADAKEAYEDRVMKQILESTGCSAIKQMLTGNVQ